MNSTDDANDMDGMGGMVNAGATDGVECWETARANHDFSSRHGHALAGMLGPAFVAAVAYVDPGNVAANITSGARYGYLLVWVLVLANCMSVLIQYQSAKLGIVTGKSLPEILGERLGDGGRFMFFMQAEVIAIATDLAEVIGGAIALKLLFGLPLFIGGCIIGIISTVLLIFQKSATHHIFEKLIIALLLVITFGFIAGLFIDPPNPAQVLQGLVPHFQRNRNGIDGNFHAGRHGDAARDLPAFHAGERPLRARRAQTERKDPATRKQNRRVLGIITCWIGESCTIDSCGEFIAWHDRHGYDRGCATGHSACARSGDRHDFLGRIAGFQPEFHVGRHICGRRNHAWTVADQSADVGMPRGDARTGVGGIVVC